MTKTQFLQLLGIAAMIGLVVLFMNSRTAAPPPAAPAVSVQPSAGGAPESAPQNAGPAAAAPAAPPAPAPAVSNEEPTVTRDPFQLPALLKEVLRQKELAKQVKPAPKENGPAQPAAEPNLKLQGILWGTSQPKAIINRHIVSVGDTIEDATIIAVGKNGVTVSFGGQDYVLKLSTKGSGSGQSSLGGPQQTPASQSF